MPTDMRHRKPRFTFVTAVYDSEPYLPAYLDSLAALAGGHDDLEVLFVDDGSPDNSVALIDAWIARTGAPARVLRKAHGGSVTARNFGLDHARGEWVSFPDPDDVLDEQYLAAIRSFLAECEKEGGSPVLLAPKVVRFFDDPADAQDDHPLGYRYHEGRRLVRLAAEPRYFHTHSPSGFYRRAVVEAASIRLDPQLPAGFEDAAFAGDYLLGFDNPVIGIVPDAVYRYRRRTDSVTGTMWSRPERYTAVPERGYLRLLSARTPAPAWVQLLVAYDLIWYFWEYDQPGSVNRAIDPALAAEFLALLDRVLVHLDEPVLAGYPLHPIPLHIRVALATRKTGRVPAPEAVVESDDGRALVVRYFTTTADAGVPEVSLDGARRAVAEHAQRAIEYYGDVFVVEHTVRVDGAGTVGLQVDGVPTVLHSDAGGAARFRWERGERP